VEPASFLVQAEAPSFLQHFAPASADPLLQHDAVASFLAGVVALFGAPRGVRKISINTFKDERALQPN